MIVAAVHHMAGSLDTLVCVKGQHHIEITRTNILIDTHIPLPKVNLLLSENTRNLLTHQKQIQNYLVNLPGNITD